MNLLKHILTAGILFLASLAMGQMADPPVRISGSVVDETGQPIPGARITIINNDGPSTVTDMYGKFSFNRLQQGSQVIVVYSLGFKSVTDTVLLTENEKDDLLYRLLPLSAELAEIEIAVQSNQIIERLRTIRGTQLFAAKKNDIVRPSEMVANKGANNARQIYAKVSGLNIWESDYGGNQLEIGGRGLSPSRTSNFNTRQNGYDISADPLGYPETYYSPPAEAIDRIDILRGASSLQFGSQFGGMVNFILKEKEGSHWIEGESSQTLGSFGLFNSYNALGLSHKNHSFYGFVNYRTSDGWKDFSKAENQTFYGKYLLKASNNLNLSFAYTANSYLAQQPGGLTDKQFNEDMYQVTRKRNWFATSWNMPVFELQWKLGNNLQLNHKTFGLLASRDALGFLSSPNIQDPAENSFDAEFRKQRNLLSDQFTNLGTETRLLSKHKIFRKDVALTTGVRYYAGLNNKQQGYASSGDEANFEYLSEDFPGISSYEFNNKNIAAFAEALLYASNKWSYTAGLRYENINTSGKGQYRELRRAPDNSVIFDSTYNDEMSNQRGFAIAGFGASYRIKPSLELFTNFSQNYRSITFNDVVVQNPAFRIDPNIEDERGFNLDLGFKGVISRGIGIDLTVFYLKYANRIGLLLAQDEETFSVFRLRTNIGKSSTYGFESLVEIDPLSMLEIKSDYRFKFFANTSVLSGKYQSADPSINGNKIELVPDLTVRTGVKFGYKKLEASLQFTYVNDHFSDASNAFETANGVSGLIPSYRVFDLGFRYAYKAWTFESGVNNLSNSQYFTRRATGYPGPGIIPANPRNMYLSVGIKF